MEAIRTSRLTLEPLVVAHADAMFDLLGDQNIYRYLDYPPPPSVESLRDRYRRLETRASPDGRQAWLNWIVCPHGRPPLGYVQATVPSDRDAYVAYVFATNHWGHGFAREAVHAMLEHLAASYDVNQYRATVEAGNERSIRLLRRLGFQLATRSALGAHNSSTELVYVKSANQEDHIQRFRERDHRVD
ncbi:MAG: GNAT family N-acetyltransferase [Burkholderiaceae bacterium]